MDFLFHKYPGTALCVLCKVENPDICILGGITGTGTANKTHVRHIVSATSIGLLNV